MEEDLKKSISEAVAEVVKPMADKIAELEGKKVEKNEIVDEETKMHGAVDEFIKEKTANPLSGKCLNDFQERSNSWERSVNAAKLLALEGKTI